MTDEETPTTHLEEALLPVDAGVHAAGLERILLRIPKEWGRTINCDAGWYPLITRLDEDIAELVGDYQIQQLKEKYGTLRFYWSVSEISPPCCVALAETDPVPFPAPLGVPHGRTAEQQALQEAWWDRLEAHLNSTEHLEAVEAFESTPEMLRRREVLAHVEQLVAGAERASATVCERCSATGAPRKRGALVKTLCASCAETLEFTA